VIPSTGWLPQGSNTNSPPEGRLLPEEFVARYTEGGDGIILGSTEVDFKQVRLLFVTSFIRERFGYGRSAFSGAFVRILNIDLVQPNVFGVLLLDSFTPPGLADEFFEFIPYTQGACIGCIPPEEVLLSLCAMGEDVVVSEASETLVSFAESAVTAAIFTEG